MGSNSSSETATDTDNVAIDDSSTMGDGIQILDSIIVDPSDKVLVETVKQTKAAFVEMMSGSNVQLTKLLELASGVLEMVDTQQVALTGIQYEQLRSGVQFLELQKEQGRYLIEFADSATSKSFNLAENVVEGNAGALDRALDIVAEVKTNNRTDTLKAVATIISLFGLGAIYLATKGE